MMDYLRRWPDKPQHTGFACLREARLPAQIAVAGMDGLRAGDVGGCNDIGSVEIAVFVGRWADADRFICQPDVKRVGIRGGVDGYRLDSHLLAGANDPNGNLAAIGDQYLLEHGGVLIV